MESLNLDSILSFFSLLKVEKEPCVSKKIKSQWKKSLICVFLRTLIFKKMSVIVLPVLVNRKRMFSVSFFTFPQFLETFLQNEFLQHELQFLETSIKLLLTIGILLRYQMLSCDHNFCCLTNCKELTANNSGCL